MATTATDIWGYRGLIANLTSREVKVKYKRSALGWLWSLINPASTLAIYTIVFSTVLRVDPPVAGDGETKSFAIFLFAALVPWSFFSNVVNGSMVQMVANGPLLKKVYFPPACPIIALSLATLLQTGLEALILLVVLTLTGLLTVEALLLVPILALLALFALGIGLILALGNVYYRDVNYLFGILLNALFYATPIVYPLSIVPEEAGGLPMRTLVSCNPLTQFVGAARDVTYLQQVPSAGRWGALVASAAISLVVGWKVFDRKARDLSEEL